LGCEGRGKKETWRSERRIREDEERGGEMKRKGRGKEEKKEGRKGG
jgi:hypothetical protein